MRIVFEYEDGNSMAISGLKMNKINERTPKHGMLDRMLSDPNVKRMYIIANDNDIRC